METFKEGFKFILLMVFLVGAITALMLIPEKKGEYTEPNGKFATADSVKISALASLLNQAGGIIIRTFQSVCDLEDEVEKVFSNISSSDWDKKVKDCGFDKVYKDVDRKWGDFIREESKKYGVDYKIVIAKICTESGGNPNAVNLKSKTGAWGLMQVLLSTAGDYGVYTKEDLLDPEMNIHVGVQRLAKARQFAGNDPGAVFVYHWGETGSKRKLVLCENDPAKSDDWQFVQAIIRVAGES